MFDELGALFNQDKLMYMMSFLIASRADLRSSSNPYLILEALMIKLCKIDEMEDVAALVSKLSTNTALVTKPSAEKRFAETNSNANRAGAAPGNYSPNNYTKPVANPHQTPEHSHQEEPHIEKVEFNEENLLKMWPRIEIRTKKISGMCSAALKNSKLREVEGKNLVLTLDSQTDFNMLKNNLENLQTILRELFHESISLSLKLLETESPTKVHIQRRTLEDVKKESPELSKFIELTDSVLT